jgi:hypothetical protein
MLKYPGKKSTGRNEDQSESSNQPAKGSGAVAKGTSQGAAKAGSKGDAKRKGTSGKGAPKGAVTRRELLSICPVRNPALEWAEEDEQVVLHVKRANNWKTRLITIFTQVPESRRVVLDPIGTHVWLMMDGETTFEAIAKSLAGEFQLMPREAELSLQQFFKELGRRGYVLFKTNTSNTNTSTRREH